MKGNLEARGGPLIPNPEIRKNTKKRGKKKPSKNNPKNINTNPTTRKRKKPKPHPPTLTQSSTILFGPGIGQRTKYTPGSKQN